MKRKRLDRDLKWGFQHFPYYQMRIESEIYRGFVSLIELTDGDFYYWEYPNAGKVPVCGKGMFWLQLIPDEKKQLITAMCMPKEKNIKGKVYPCSVSTWYVDVIEDWEYDPDGIAAYIDKYLDVRFSPQEDIIIDDRDELEEAYNTGELTPAQYEAALTECDYIIKDLCTDIEATEQWCSEIMEIVRKRIAQGEQPVKKK